MNKKHPLFAFGLILLAAAVGGGVSVLVKISLISIPPFTFTFLRFFIACISFVPLLYLRKIKIILNKSILSISLFAVLNVILFAIGIPYVLATIATLLYSLVPIFIIIFSYLLYKTKVTATSIIGIIIGLSGIFLITGQSLLHTIETGSSLFTGTLIILTAVIVFALYSIGTKKLQIKYQPILLTFVFCLMTVVLTIPFVLYENISTSFAWINFLLPTHILMLGFVGILGSVIFYLLLQYAVKFGSPLISSLTLFIQPVMTYFWAYFLLKETITPTVFLSALLIFTSAYLVVKEKS